MTKFKVPPPPAYRELRIGDQIGFLGLNLRDMDSSIGDGQSPYMPNMNLDDGGKPTKRKGQEYWLTSAVEAPINGYYDELFNNKHVFHGGTKLYSADPITKQVTVLQSGLTNQKGFFYVFNDILYYKNKAEFYGIDATFTITSVINSSTTYIPMIAINTPPAGGGTKNEDRNIANKYVKQGFTPDGTATAYTLAYQYLDSSAVTASLDSGVIFDKVEGTHFNVNRTTGVVTWNTPPAKVTGVNNTCVFKFSKDFGDTEKILGSYHCTLYGGGTNDSRVFCTGNDDYKNIYWYTGLTGNTFWDGTYYPEFSFNRIGSDAKSISGWSYLYSKLIALKEDGLYQITYNNTGTAVTFPVNVLSSQTGCDMPGSIQIIKGVPVFGNSERGLFTIVSTLIESEKNVAPMSGLINLPPVNGISPIPGLLEHDYADLKNCSSFDDGQKYYLCIKNEVYVWDYEKSPFSTSAVLLSGVASSENTLIWYYYTNMNANCWARINRETYYGDRTTGQIIKFTNNRNDFGQGIEACWKSKLFDFGMSDFYKTIEKVWVTTRAGSYSQVNIRFYSDGGMIEGETTVNTSSFSLAHFSLEGFSLAVYPFPPTLPPFRPKIKKAVYFQIELCNNNVNQNLSLLKLVINYSIGTNVR